MALIDTSLLITEASNWRTGYKMHGTPGYSNIPPRISGLYLNEISGQEQTIYPDNFGEYEDWLEIYNASGQDINFGGLYLTDDLKDLTKSRIRQNDPDSTTIPALGYQVLFADGQLDQGILHLDFKISASGEELGLIQLVGLDTVVLDQLVFGSFTSGASLGRRTDGNAPWEKQEFTPGSSNVSLSIERMEGIFASIYPNPASDVLFISFSEGPDGDVNIQMVNTLGQVVLSSESPNMIPGQLLSLDISALETGIYFLKLKSERFNSVERIVIAR